MAGYLVLNSILVAGRLPAIPHCKVRHMSKHPQIDPASEHRDRDPIKDHEAVVTAESESASRAKAADVHRKLAEERAQPTAHVLIPGWLAPILQGVTLLAIIGCAFWLGTVSSTVSQTSAKVDALYTQVLVGKDSLNSRVTILEARTTAIETSVEAMDTKLQAMDTKLQAVDTKLQTMDTKLEAKLEAMDTKLNRIVATVKR